MGVSEAKVGFMKTLLTVFNFIFWVTGIAVLALGIWMKIQLYIYMELTNIYYKEAPYILIGVGAGIVVIGSLGCCCTIKGNAPLLYMFGGFLLLVFVVELAVGIAGFVYRGKLEEGFKAGIQTAIQEYSKGGNKKKAIDGLQEGLQCCGMDVYSDWFTVQWDGDKTPADSVPKTCCKDKTNCVNENLPKNGTNLSIYTEGCYKKVTSFMESKFLIIGLVAIGFAFLQLFGALLACGLAKNINKAKYEQLA